MGWWSPIKRILANSIDLRRFYVLDEMWPDFQIEQFYEALEWYQDQDITLGG